ncbi:glycoside hydrolase family 35 protein [Diplodia corticola]|uniref:Beta-galactosidase n=1 Tax=Diplodia corticola TaxID=236234 RepID=A0A1J9RBT2_9PEZI|nr:glycoside hydrolase family 35 protein [Diplodia corticola]OJD37610.1 glycoside hydrolase family 35 protein [Diplodia corticola]
MKLSTGLLAASLASQALGAAVSAGKPTDMIKPYKREALQDIVTWDEHSIFVNGERIIFLSGEYHPFRLPVPSLWLDVFHKIKALGFSGVSFYVDWALLEGTPGEFTAEGVFAWEPFFDAAKEAGIYLLARPGPYINAEVSGGGFPGWLQRVNGTLRTDDEAYINSTANYAKNIGEIIAKAQITNGGPIILFQPENEYTGAVEGVEFPNENYWAIVEKQFRDTGIVVPYINNDASAKGYFAPGSNWTPQVDIYGHDGYPLGFDCANPYTWPDGGLPQTWRELHEEQSPSTPYALVEFQGGSFDPWGGLGFDQCSVLLNHEFERVFYKNLQSFGATIMNFYMIFGGTNWGNLGHPGGYTSYDYGSVIRETREIDREKYSELKLQGNFLKASPAYLTAVPGEVSNGSYASTTALAVTPLLGNVTNFFVVRHAAYNSLESTSYTITVPTSKGDLTLPQLNGTLTLNGRDSKVHVTDYDVGGENLLYSTAEIFTWQKYDDKTVLVVYGGPNEAHELAFSSGKNATLIEGSGVTITAKNGATILHWSVTPTRKTVKVGESLYLYILDRNSAYNYWTHDDIVLKAGYLIRNASVDGSTLSIVGDLNATTTLEVIGGAPSGLTSLTFNGEDIDFTQSPTTGSVSASLAYTPPDISLPDLSSLSWKSLDTLPELSADYDDSAWPAADQPYTLNTLRPLTTPTSLYAGDYGYHYGTLLFRGHFTATGTESSLYLSAQGGFASGFSVFLGSTHLGSWTGADYASNGNVTLPISGTTAGEPAVLTVVLDTTGISENWVVGAEEAKLPRGILDFAIEGGVAASAVSWKLTGNLGGEKYVDHSRGPLNEGGLFAERAGFHLPGAPTTDAALWADSTGPATDGLAGPGAKWYVTTVDLDIPAGWDVPVSFSFANGTATNATATATASAYRAQLFVNGWQFGKYIHNIGPQDVFPVPEGIWDYRGSNTVAVSVFGQEEAGVAVEGLELVLGGTPVKTGFGAVEVVKGESWGEREGVY